MVSARVLTNAAKVHEQHQRVFGSGFTAGGMVLNYSAKVNGTRLRLTDEGVGEAGSAWYPTPANVQTFTTDSSFRLLRERIPRRTGLPLLSRETTLRPLTPGEAGVSVTVRIHREGRPASPRAWR